MEASRRGGLWTQLGHTDLLLRLQSLGPLSPPSARSSLAKFNHCHSEEGEQGATA